MSSEASHVPPVADEKTLNLVLAAHRRAAYEAGYARATADVMACGVFLAEASLKDCAHPAEARAAVYRFLADLQHRTRRLAEDAGDVSDGLGI